MSGSHGGLRVVVVTADPQFGERVADTVDSTADEVHADAVVSLSFDDLDWRSVDGVLLDAEMRDPVSVVKTVSARGVPVVLLADSSADTVGRALDAGAIDVVPRTTTTAQYELVVDRIARHTTGARPERQTKADRRSQEYEQIFNKVTDAIAVFDPETGEIVDVNESYHELLGYDDIQTIRELGIEGLSAVDEGYTGERGKELIREVGETGTSTTVGWLGEDSEGDRIWLEATLSPAEIGGEERVLSIQRDVTERRELEQTYQDIFENVSDGLVVHDPETGEILEVNDRYCEITGYDRPELLEGTIRLILPAEDAYGYEDAVERIRRARVEGPQLFEFKGQRKNGEAFTGEIHLRTVDIRGTERVLASVRDITERKRRERAIAALQDATERLQSAKTPDQVASIAAEAASETLDLPMARCWLFDGETETLDPVAETDAVGEHGLTWEASPDSYEYETFLEDTIIEYTPREQSSGPSLGTGVLLPLADHGLVAAGSDEDAQPDDTVLDVAAALADHVTTALDRVEREQAVRESERRFRLIAERIDEVIYLAEPDFSEVLYVNPAYEDIWGHPTDELYDDARAFLDSVDARDRDTFESRFDEMITDIRAGDADGRYDFEFRVRHPEEGLRWVTASGYSVELSDGTHRFVGIAEEVTDRKRREQRLEVFNRILRHNLRNQLDVIRSHAEELRGKTASDDADHIISSVDELAAIGAEARRTDQIVSTDEPAGDISLSEVVEERIADLRPHCDDVDVAVETPGSATVVTNRGAIRVAVESALENAVEHALSRVSVSITEERDGYAITIHDDGPGIPDEELVPIESGTETTLAHGTGLGLWQLRWGVNRCNGELSFDTSDGTTVCILVPDQSQQD